MRGVVVGVLLVSGGCSVKLDFGGTSYACGEGGACPPGYSCVSGQCLATTPTNDGAPGSDGTLYDAAPLVRCGSVTLMADDFEDGTRDERWGDSFADTGMSLTEEGGRLTVGYAADAADRDAAYFTSDWYDLRDSRFGVRAVSVPNQATSARMSLIAVLDDNNFIEIAESNGSLIARMLAGGSTEIVRTRGYNPNPHRYWAIEEQGGTIYWETSGDGVTWAMQAEMPTPFDVQYIRMYVGGGTEQATSNPGLAVFDDMNGGTPSGSWCAASSLSDDFEDGTRSNAWFRSFTNPGCTSIEETGGELVIALSDANTSYCGYGSSSLYDLRDDAVTVEVTEVPAGAAQAMLVVSDRSGSGAELVAESGMLFARRFTSSSNYTDVSMVPIDLAAQRYWRIRTAGNQVVWETSGDGAAFTEIGTATDVLDTSAVLVELVAGTYVATPTPGTARFARLN